MPIPCKNQSMDAVDSSPLLGAGILIYSHCAKYPAGYEHDKRNDRAKS